MNSITEANVTGLTRSDINGVIMNYLITGILYESVESFMQQANVWCRH